MANYLILNDNGHYITTITVTSLGTGIAGESLLPGNLVYLKGTDSKLYKVDGSEAAASAAVGLADNTYNKGDTIRYYQVGDTATGLSNLTPGTEYWGKEDGTMAPYSSVSSQKYTRSIGVAIAVDTLQVQFGCVMRKP